jgi:hypothetical protein
LKNQTTTINKFINLKQFTMKKLALALVCLLSVAFFTSCVEDPIVGDPTITVFNAQGYVQDGMVLQLNEQYPISFICNSNALSGKNLTKFVIKVNDETWIDSTIFATQYTFDSFITFTPTKGDTVAVNITATVTDEAGQTASAQMNIGVIMEDEVELVPTPVEWYRWGSTITGLDEYGLEWKGNYSRDYYAKIVPAAGVTLLTFSSKDWDATKTETEKLVLFHNAIENGQTAEYYWNVNVTQGDMTYDDVIGTIMPDGTLNLIHITRSTTVSHGSQGAETTISGEAK